MKRIIYIFLIMANFIFASSLIEGIRFNEAPQQIVFDIANNAVPVYMSMYDKDTRLLFLEIDNSKLAKSIEATIEKNDEVIEKIESMEFNGKSNFFITFKEGVNYSIFTLKTPSRLVVNMNKEEKMKPIIVLDAGHGGKDTGATNGQYLEKDVNLQMIKLLGKELEKDFNVYYTREDDTFISLGGRSEFSNGKKAVLFVSIHINANVNKAANGTEVFYFSKNPSTYAKAVADFENAVDKKFGIKESAVEFLVGDIIYKQNQERSTRLARLIVDGVANVTGFYNRGVHGANFAVLRGSEVPAVLIELGFVSNDEEAAKLSDPDNQKNMAVSISKSIRAYLK